MSDTAAKAPPSPEAPSTIRWLSATRNRLPSTLSCQDLGLVNDESNSKSIGGWPPLGFTAIRNEALRGPETLKNSMTVRSNPNQAGQTRKPARSLEGFISFTRRDELSKLGHWPVLSDLRRMAASLLRLIPPYEMLREYAHSCPAQEGPMSYFDHESCRRFNAKARLPAAMPATFPLFRQVISG